MKGSLLIISDDEKTVSVFGDAKNDSALKITSKKGLSAGLKAMSGPEAVLLDLPDAVGALKEIKSYNPEAVVVVMASREELKRAIEEGAYSFLEKPCDASVLRHSIGNALVHLALREELSRRIEPPQLVAKSPVMLKVVKLIEKTALQEAPVLISGESGTGKALIARSIHCLSHRKTGPFMSVEAGKELPSVLSRAEGGSLYVRRCKPETLAGLTEAMTKTGIDVRLICGMEGDSPVRQAVCIKLPPLRDRKEDIAPLAEHFLGLAESSFGGGKKGFSKNARKALLSHDWPGNVKELDGAVKKAYILSEGPQIGARHLCIQDATPYRSIKEFLEEKLKRYIKESTKLGNSRLYDTVVSEVEKSLIELALRETEGNQIRAAKTLGMNRNTLRAKIKAYRIKNG